MEVYSTVLWHLKKDSALAFLCHVLKETDFHAPQTWCAVGNAFSLAREHDQATAAFKRAVQVDEKFAYAHTLMGHEYIANEEFDAALTCFRKAVAADRRGFGGWYGLGRSFEKMGKLEDAERHYRIAASINPSNSTLLVCIGVVLERLRNKKGALANYTRALELAPQSALARFKKARVLMHLRYFEEALQELEVLRDAAPDEANVWFLLGKCYKGLGERGEALRSLTTALNLDVKVRGQGGGVEVTVVADLFCSRRHLLSRKRWRRLMRRTRRVRMTERFANEPPSKAMKRWDGLLRLLRKGHTVVLGKGLWARRACMGRHGKRGYLGQWSWAFIAMALACVLRHPRSRREAGWMGVHLFELEMARFQR